MCSAVRQTNLIIEAIQSGANDFIIKPFQTSCVLEAVDKAIGKESRSDNKDAKVIAVLIKSPARNYLIRAEG